MGKSDARSRCLSVIKCNTEVLGEACRGVLRLHGLYDSVDKTAMEPPLHLSLCTEKKTLIKVACTIRDEKSDKNEKVFIRKTGEKMLTCEMIKNIKYRKFKNK